MADFNKRGPGCDDCEDGERGERGERGKRGKRGHDGHDGHDGAVGPTGATGLTGATGPAVVPMLDCFPFQTETVEIYARTTGSDTLGDGSLANPFRTFQRAMCAVIEDYPNNLAGIVAPGKSYIVDITDLGVENLPLNYQFPVVQLTRLNGPVAPTFLGYPGTSRRRALEIRATPRLALPGTDGVITAADGAVVSVDPDTGLVVVTLAAPRPSWAAGALKGRMVIRSLGSSTANSVIYDSSATQLFLTNSAANMGGAGPLALAPGEELRVVEPSAELSAPASVASDNSGIGIQCVNISSIGFRGIKFTCSSVPFVSSLLVDQSSQPQLEMCDIQGINVGEAAVSMALIASTVRVTMNIETGALIVQKSYCVGQSTNHLVGDYLAYSLTVFDGCAPIRNSGISGIGTGPGTAGLVTGGSSVFRNCLITGTVGETGDAILCAGGRWDLGSVKIQGAAGNAINAERGSNYIVLANVTGSGNVGFGVKVNDGAVVQVLDNLTLVTGALGNMKVGTLAPRTWLDFRTAAPIKNEYDLSTPFVVASSGVEQPPGDELTGAGTGGRSGSRMFQRA